MNIFERVKRAWTWHRNSQVATVVRAGKRSAKKAGKYSKTVARGLERTGRYINEPRTQKRLGHLAQIGRNVDAQGRKLSELLWGD